MKFKLPVILLVILLGIYWQWFLPGPRVATDFSQVSENILKAHFSLPQTWSVFGTEGLGEYTVFTLWSWPFNFVYSFFAELGLSFSILERLFIVLPFLVVGSISIWKILSRFNLSDYAKIVATFFYLSNTYILLVIDGGQLSISLAYALFPLCFLVLENATEGVIKKSILLGLIVSLMGFFDVRFIYVFAILAVMRFIYEFLFLNLKNALKWIIKWIRLGFISGAIIIGLNFFWLYILHKAPISSNFYSYLTQTSFEKLISLGNTLFLLSPHWYKNVFGEVTSLKWEFIGIPLLVFLAPILKSKNRPVGFWLIVALISIFLTKGASEPLSSVYPWLYSNIPGFSFFRDPSKFFFLITLSYTFLIGISVDEIIKRVKNYKIKFGLIAAFLSYLVIIIRPVWLGSMTGTFSPPPRQTEYSQLNNLILNEKRESNIFWIPTISPLTVLNAEHPALEAVRLASLRPFGQANLGTYEKFNFLREAPYMGEIFDVLNIGYIVYPPLDPRRDDMKPDHINYYNLFLNQLSNLSWLSKINQSEIPIFKVKKFEDKLFMTPNIWWVVGSDSIYKEATTSSKLKLAKNSLIFEEESKNLGKRLNELPFANILLFHKTILDLALSFIDSNELIFPANSLNHDPNSSLWWKRDTANFLEWRDFLKIKYGINNQDFDLGGGWAVAEGNLKLNLKSEELQKNNILLARVLESSRSGQISFYQKNELIGQINTKNVGDNIRWFEVGTLMNDGEINIQTRGNINVINAITAIPENKFKEYKDKADSYRSRLFDFEDSNIKENSAELTYKQINPTKYEIYIKNLDKPAMLVFSQNFNSFWKLNGKSPLPVYSLLNGYIVSENGKYELEFEPQKYVLTGLIVSVVTLLSCLILLLV